MIDDDPAYFADLVEQYRPYISGVISDRAIELQGQLFQTDGGFTEEYVQATIQFLTDATVIEGELGVDDIADFSYLDQALQGLGG